MRLAAWFLLPWLVLVAIIVASCASDSGSPEPTHQVDYVYDARTGMCFALLHNFPQKSDIGHNYVGAIEVNCSNQIVQLAGFTTNEDGGQR